MHCPIDGATLLLSHRQDVEIDYCPECRGVWLDRGELDKIVVRGERDTNDRLARWDRDPDDHRNGGAPRKKKRGWLSEIFEVD